MSTIASYWMIPVGIAIIGVSLALLTLWQIRRQRQTRLTLRVLSGQRRLLGEEIDERLEQLRGFDEADLEQKLLAAPGFVDHVHVGLLERQAHLQNLEDLTHLQRHKIAVLAHHLAQTTPTDLTQEEELPGTGMSAVEEHPESVDEQPATRGNLEDDLLGRIGQHAAPKPPRKRK
ncbi:MAG: hypothetical protein HN712_05030 [Gemmatimonadetes bacterium]|nr:hypothetical protein [Gemmatimonadota bacterium]MBT7859650.1 hypothetical protein [Gemmatimonadota bacterium]